MRKMLITVLTALLLGPALCPRASGQSEAYDLGDLKRRQKQERKELEAQEKVTKRTLKGPGHSRLERKRMRRQMKLERKLLRRGQRDELETAKAQRKFAKQNPDDLHF